jgi:hypothetical protein
VRSAAALAAAAAALPDEGTYSAAIGACDAAGEAAEAVRLFVAARQRGLFVAAWGQAAGTLMDNGSSPSGRRSGSRSGSRSSSAAGATVGKTDTAAADAALAALRVAEESSRSDSFAVGFAEGETVLSVGGAGARGLVVDLRACSSAVSRAAVRALVRDLEAGRVPLSGLAFLAGNDGNFLGARGEGADSTSPGAGAGPVPAAVSAVSSGAFSSSSSSSSPPFEESSLLAASPEPLLIACETVVELGRVAREAALKGRGSSRGSSRRGLGQGLGGVVALGRQARTALDASLADLALTARVSGDGAKEPQSAWLLLEEFILGWLKSGKA